MYSFILLFIFLASISEIEIPEIISQNFSNRCKNGDFADTFSLACNNNFYKLYPFSKTLVARDFYCFFAPPVKEFFPIPANRQCLR